jgi:hypothetical protein
MDLCDAQDLVRWAAPPSWPNDIVVRVTRLLCDGRSVRSTARAVNGADRGPGGRRPLARRAAPRLPTIWSCPSRAVLAVASRVIAQRGREAQFQRKAGAPYLGLSKDDLVA